MSPEVSAALLPLLLCLSAFFSASETALFSLTRGDRTHLAARQTRAARCVLHLLEQPRSLLVAVLFGNLLVNFLLFASAARVSAAWTEGEGAVIAAGLLTTGVVIVLGEITPKSIAVTKPLPVALFTAPPLLLFRDATRLVGLINPLERVVVWLLDRVERRLPPPQGPLTDEELRRFVGLQGQQGQLERQASEFLADVLTLGSRRVHEVMTPRVDVVALDVTKGREDFVELVRTHRMMKVPVHDGGGLDHISGYLSTREVMAQPERDLRELIKPLWFVPHTKSLESLLREMAERHEPLALVVGEYGGTEGIVTLEDVVEEITGDIARHDASPLLEAREDGTWQIAGRFPLREAAELLGIKVPVPGPTTLSGFVAHLLGRIPEVGDLAWFAGVQFRVDAVERQRATRIRVALPTLGRGPDRGDGGDEGPAEELTRSGAQRANVRLARWIAESNPDEPPARPGGRVE